MSRWLATVSLLATLAVAPPPAIGQTLSTTGLLGKPAPAMKLKDLAGKPLDLAAYKGKVVIVDFWATWCVPCREEIPSFNALVKKYGAKGFAVIGVSMDDSADPIPAFVKKYAVGYPVALGDSALADRFGGILGLPVAFVIDRDGLVRQRFDGMTSLADFEKAVTAWLK
jgi:thiol-disulfide isomerase/thioredoxin